MQFIVIIAAVLLLAACEVSNNYNLPLGNFEEAVSYTDCGAVIETYPHSAESFTEGLFFHEGELYESTGLKGESYIYGDIDMHTGKAKKVCKLDDEYFGEGSVIFEDMLYYLTWQENQAFVLDPETFTVKKRIDYNREGWGLTTDGENLIASDGTSKIFYMDGELNTVREMSVTYNRKPVKNLNELEYINGRIWANVWMTNNVLIIDPQSGVVEKIINFDGLIDESLVTPETDVMNGIAYDKSEKAIYLTGKNWSAIFKYELF